MGPCHLESVYSYAYGGWFYPESGCIDAVLCWVGCGRSVSGRIERLLPSAKSGHRKRRSSSASPGRRSILSAYASVSWSVLSPYIHTAIYETDRCCSSDISFNPMAAPAQDAQSHSKSLPVSRQSWSLSEWGLAWADPRSSYKPDLLQVALLKSHSTLRMWLGK